MNSSSTSPADSSISTTAVAGGSTSNVALSVEDFNFASDLISNRKDEALLALKSDLMAALNKEVKSLDDDNWKFDGPRSRIHLVSKPGVCLAKKMEIVTDRNSTPSN